MPDFVAFVGIDVGKTELVAHVLPSGLPSGQDARFANTPAGIAKLLGWLAGLEGAVSVVFEATGGYEHALWQALAGAGISARQHCPRRVRHFARARGRLAKTDRIDAVTLAEYAVHFPGEGRAWPGPRVAALSALVLRRQSLVELRKAVLTRRGRSGLAELERLDRQLERQLDRRIAAPGQARGKLVEALIAATIARDGVLAAKASLLRSVPGIGPVLTSCLLARMPELGGVTAGEAAAMAGVAPLARDSGAHQGKRRIDGGRREVRRVLFQAALCACRHNPAIAAFAARLKAAGKAHKQVVIAAARKLLMLANAVLKRGTPWQPA